MEKKETKHNESNKQTDPIFGFPIAAFISVISSLLGSVHLATGLISAISESFERTKKLLYRT